MCIITMVAKIIKIASHIGNYLNELAKPGFSILITTTKKMIRYIELTIRWSDSVSILITSLRPYKNKAKVV